MVELIHLATLVHDDSVDHSVLRRGMPTINSLFSHQVSVIMGDYLYSRAVIELVRLDDLEPLRVLSRVTNEMTVGEMRQLLAHDPLEFSEEQYDLLIQAKTASLVSGACEVGALRRHPTERARPPPLRRGAGHGVPDRRRPARLHRGCRGHRQAVRLGPREHKVTLPLIAALPRMDEAERRRSDPAAADPPEPSDAQIAEVIMAVSRAGGLEYARERALRLAQQAEGELDAAAALRGAGRAAGQHHLRRRSQTLMPTGPRRPGFYLGSSRCRLHRRRGAERLSGRALPDSAARTFFTSTWTATFGPVSADLLVVSFTLGPIGLHVSLLSLIGVLLAYLIARSLF